MGFTFQEKGLKVVWSGQAVIFSAFTRDNLMKQVVFRGKVKIFVI